MKCIGIVGRLFGHRFYRGGFIRDHEYTEPLSCLRCGYIPTRGGGRGE